MLRYRVLLTPLIAQRSRQFITKSSRYFTATSQFWCGDAKEKVPAGQDCKASAPTVQLGSQLLQEAFGLDKSVKAASDANGSLGVIWSDGTRAEYPHVWLRDNCTCKECYNPSSSSRLLALADLDTNVRPADISVDGGVVSITWRDGHKSTFDSQWLHARTFVEEEQIKRLEALSPRKPRAWGRILQNDLPTFDFLELTTNNKTLYEWISVLEQIGLAIVNNAPRQTGQIDKIAERVEFLRENHYGNNFTVKAKLDPSNLAYTSSSLGLHTDLPFYYYTPGMQMLHCIEQVPTEGGENQFSDGFNAAYILKDRHPEMFELLKTLPVDFYDIGVDKSSFFKRTRQPIIGCDLNGRINKITFNNMVRDSFLHIPLKLVPKLYSAIKTLNSIMYEPENHITYKMQSGDIACFHNYRVLHGRTSYKLLNEGTRHLEGGYIDWDELNSRKRVLLLELGLLKNGQKSEAFA